MMMTRNELEAHIRYELRNPQKCTSPYAKAWCKAFADGHSACAAFDCAWEAYQAANALVAVHADQLIEATTPPAIVALPYLWWINEGSCIAVRVESLVSKRYTVAHAFTPFVIETPPSTLNEASRLINDWKAGS